MWCLHELKADGEEEKGAADGAASAATPAGGAAGGGGALLGRRKNSLFGGASPAAGLSGGSPAGGAGGMAGALFGGGTPGGGGRGGEGGGGRVFTLPQRLGMSKLLEDNKTMGPRRVDSWRLSRSLEEVAWVFSTLCATIPAAKVDAGLPAWRGDECATFVANLGLGQYAPSFAFNLNGARLPSLRMTELNQLGVSAFELEALIAS